MGTVPTSEKKVLLQSGQDSENRIEAVIDLPEGGQWPPFVICGGKAYRTTGMTFYGAHVYSDVQAVEARAPEGPGGGP